MRVLVMTTWYPTQESPVGGVFVREHAKAAGLYDDVVVLHCAGADPKARALWRVEQESNEDLTQGLRTYRVWHRGVRLPVLRNCASLYTCIMAFRRVRASGFRPQVIHAHIYDAAFHAILLGKLYSLPVLVTEHSSAFPRKLLGKKSIWKARFAFSRAAVVMPVSEALKRAIQSYGIEANFQVVPNVVDTTLFHSNRPSRSGDLKRVLLVCLLDDSDNKGIPDLFNALQSLGRRRDDWHLDIVGDGPGRAKYEQMALQLGIADKVTFHGMKPKLEVADIMRRASFLVVASRFETFCVVAAEALATGTPVLSTRCGGPEDFVTDEVGFLVPPNDQNALERGLEYMMNHAHSYSPERISRYALERFAPERVGKQLHDVYRACMR